MSLTILSNVAASQRIVDLLNYTNQKNISLAQVDFNSLTANAVATIAVPDDVKQRGIGRNV